MKKFFTLLCLLLVGGGAFAADFVVEDFNAKFRECYANFDSKNQTIANNQIAYLESITVSTIPEGKKHMAMTAYSNALQQIVPSISFEQFVAKLNAFEKTLKFKSPLPDSERWTWFNAWRRVDWKVEGLAYLKTFKDHESFHDAGYWYYINKDFNAAFHCYSMNANIKHSIRCLGIYNDYNIGSPDVCYNIINKILTQKVKDDDAIYVINRVIQCMVGNPAFDESKTKTLLKNINRKYSSKLISDKAKWEPVIAKIRTALETY